MIITILLLPLGHISFNIGSGRTVLLVGKSSSKGIRRGALLYWRMLPHRIFGFGTHLAWQDQTMISMCCTTLRYFLGLPNALLLRFPM
jgi:hypothetical protein